MQVSVGLLLASVSAVTALAEERVRGSMDVLLATPLTTRAIVWGKWRGAFRRIPPLAILPMINCALLAMETQRWWSLVFMLAIVLAYGAWVTSLGLLLATWIKRLGRAIGTSAAIYAVVAAGWIMLIAALGGSGSRDVFEFLGTASPFFGPGELAFVTGRYSDLTYWKCYGHLAFWFGAYSIAALVMYGLVLASFNHCLGRTGTRAPRFAGGRAKGESAGSGGLVTLVNERPV